MNNIQLTIVSIGVLLNHLWYIEIYVLYKKVNIFVDKESDKI